MRELPMLECAGVRWRDHECAGMRLRIFRPSGQVAATLGQRKHGSKGGATACRSLMEGSHGRAVGNLAQERLVIRVPTAKGMKPDGLSAEVHFAPDQAV